MRDWSVRRRQQASHTALFYNGEEEYLAGVRDFITAAAKTSSPVVIAGGAPVLDRLRDELNGSAERVELLDVSELGINPARLIPAIKAAVDSHPGDTLHFVGEPVRADRSPEEISEAMLHEVLLNRAFGSARVEILCPYDVTAVGSAIIADAERAHPWLCDGEGRHHSHSYKARKLPQCCQAPLPTPPREAISLRFELGDLARVRALVSEHAGRASLAVGQCGDVVLAVDEVATNSIRHGGGSGLLRTWHEHGRLTCEVTDSGHITNPLVGRVRPEIGARGGRGLWMVNQLCDLVQIRSGPTGTTVRMHASRHRADPRAEPTFVAAQARSAA
jgi:anti-sigma regulatory factor (Ser/Thr protein kinase)